MEIVATPKKPLISFFSKNIAKNHSNKISLANLLLLLVMQDMRYFFTSNNGLPLAISLSVETHLYTDQSYVATAAAT